MRPVTGKEFARALEKNEWHLLHIRGSHHIYVKEGEPARLSVPIHANRELKVGMLKALMSRAGLTENDV